MEFVLCLIVLAIPYNQGAALPASDLELITKNDLSSSSELSPRISDGGTVFQMPTTIQPDLVITILGSLNTKDESFTVVLPSTSGSEDCQIQFFFENKTIVMSPAGSIQEPASYCMNLSDTVQHNFTLKLNARVSVAGVKSLGMVFEGDDYDESPYLTCVINDFQDIKQIIMKEGVANIHSLKFEFEQNH
ncbi:uncharacterized protein LOC113500694 [Trichoplusia ni]|uniref:Uncharacterized protein LOC113500694 n=1 Tax=Trichoplusia ni TaxID=7111 RepID=A0A7E5W9Q1_TRINI|nr:uncharacterized protein LOC113500694 [Trichoplusia ni]